MTKNGSFIETPGGKIIHQKLEDENVAAALGRLMEKMNRIEETLDQLNVASTQVPALLSIATDTLDDEIETKRKQGVDVDQQIRRSLSIILKLSEPENIAKLESLLKLTEQMPGLISMAADMFDEEIKQVQQKDLNLESRAKNGLDLLLKVTEPDTSEKLNSLIKMSDQIPGFAAMAIDAIDEGMSSNKLIGEKSLELMKGSLGAFNNASAQPPAQIGGIFGILKALKDPDRQKAFGFLMNFLKELGKTIS